jgi:AraC-like DNA-binding protein
MLAYTRPPAPALAHVVRCFHAFDDADAPQRADHHLYPECAVSLSFLDGTSWFGPPGAAAELLRVPPVFVDSTTRGQRIRLVSLGRTRMVGVELYAWGAMRLFGPLLGVSHLVGPIVPPPLAARIARLLAADELDAALGALEEFITERARQVDLAPTAAIEVATSLYASGGRGAIAALADAQSLSVRQLERQFRAQVGMAPKTLARIARFEAAKNRLLQAPATNLTKLAYELDYADQAHFSREFRAIASVSPSEYSAEVSTPRMRRIAAMSHLFKEAIAPARRL